MPLPATIRAGDDAYLNCPMDKEEYERFHEELVSAERAPIHDFDVQNPKVYEGCMPIEVMAQRGKDTVRYGPLKPVGLRDPKTGRRPWAVVQLRRENAEGTLYNLVGFQTNLKFGEQKRVFGMIPGLRHAEYARYGVMHRNTFLNSPKVLKTDFSTKENPNLYFAGQITGVEGYMESAASGILAGKNAVRRLEGKEPLLFPKTTMLGALSRHVGESVSQDFHQWGRILECCRRLKENTAIKGSVTKLWRHVRFMILKFIWRVVKICKNGYDVGKRVFGMKIIVDAFGGDNAPLEIMKGCAEAVRELHIDIILTGREEEIHHVAKENEIPLDHMEIVHAPDVITMEDHAGEVVKSKSQSSMAVGLKLLAEGKGDAFVSAGNSGSLVVGTSLIVRRIRGVKRVAFAPIMPKNEGFFMLIDGGANIDCRPEMLQQSA